MERELHLAPLAHLKHDTHSVFYTQHLMQAFLFVCLQENSIGTFKVN